ncbi:MAG: glycoside hydrolase [Anaerolineaceae bacterium]|nr:MAG: glycoside hydrolase [Anaerolineaceae bacterium]
MKNLQLCPMPHQLRREDRTVNLSDDLLIVAPPALFFEAQAAQTALHEAGKTWEIVAGDGYAHTGLILRIDETLPHAQGYTLDTTGEHIVIRGRDRAAVFYGVCTLRQLLQQSVDDAVQAVYIEDHPDFPVRGVMLDVSRDRVPTMQTLYELIDLLAAWKINQLQLYMEHTFAYRAHPDVWALASPFTGEQIIALTAYCQQRHIDLVPNQNSLGHMERWLKQTAYHHLAESPEGFTPPWMPDSHHPPTTLAPLKTGSLELIESLYDELLPHFSGDLFNVGCDEPWELGRGHSENAVKARGGRVYLDYLKELHRLVSERGRTMQFWADIIINHPQLIGELPRDVVALEWGYESNHPFEAHSRAFAEAGIPFYVCPGTSSWNALAGRTSNAIGNLRNAALHGKAHGAIGYLITDWGDHGHWQPLPVSYTGFLYGAALAWGYDANHDTNIPAMLDAFAFADDAGVMGDIAYALGDVYRMVSPPNMNGNWLTYPLRMTAEQTRAMLERAAQDGGLSVDVLKPTLYDYIERIDDIIAPLVHSRMIRADADLIRAEFRLIADLMKHAARAALLWLSAGDASAHQLRDELDGLLPRQRENWLARSRRGGLEDSMRRFEILRDAYQRAHR